MNLELNIDTLALHGFAPHERYVIAAALERELATLLRAPHAASSLIASGEHERLEAGEFVRAPNAKPNALGAQVAQTVFASLQKR